MVGTEADVASTHCLMEPNAYVSAVVPLPIKMLRSVARPDGVLPRAATKQRSIFAVTITTRKLRSTGMNEVSAPT